jgi:predicted enzyme related to lactoylglutathione lyase
MIHHIAIPCKDPRILCEFYKSLPGIREYQIHRYEDQSIRSIWLEEESGTILMLEKEDNPSPSKTRIVFSLKTKDGVTKKLEHLNPLVQKRTEYTIYFHDPENNLLGYSNYPDSFR